MKIFYHSDDGKVFETEEECIAYENRYKNFNYIVSWYHKDSEAFCEPDGLPKNLAPTFITDPKKINHTIHYDGIVYIPNEDVLEIIKEEIEEYATNVDNLAVGFNFWSDSKCNWVPPSFYRNQLLKQLNSITNFINKANEDIANFKNSQSAATS